LWIYLRVLINGASDGNEKPLPASCHEGALLLAETVSAYAVLSED